MSEKELHFVIPTYRLREVGTCVEHYDENFHCNGYSVKMFVFDDSTQSTHEKYFPLLEQTRTHNDLFYVGPKEKAEFLRMLLRRLHDRRLEPVVKNVFFGPATAATATSR
jgi:hypothetical protein